MLRRRAIAAAVLALAACRDLTVADPPAPPPPPGAGAVYGRVVVSIPGRSGRQPAVGARVEQLGSSLAATSGMNGAFRLEGVEEPAARLLFTYEVPVLGVRSKLLGLDDYGVGRGREISLGDVHVVENAAMHGRALRGDALGARFGHGNSVVFVPEGPFTAFTADDGTFTLDELPDGPIEVAVFRAGYRPATLGRITLRGGEDLALKDLVLEPLAGTPPPGGISGTVRLMPESSPTLCSVTATAVVAAQVVTNAPAADGAFTLSALEPGIYDVAARCPGYSNALIANVLVNAGVTYELGVVVLVGGAERDAGVDRPPTFDGGTLDAGPPDAGPPDAGPPDAGTCSGPGSCPLGQWCDVDVCRPNCTGPGTCNNGRICDAMTSTCVVPCSPGCPPGDECHFATMVCRRSCDAVFPCPTGMRCSNMLCVPECVMDIDCGQPHVRCNNGACMPDGSCDDDSHCLVSELCRIGGACQTRPTQRADGGTTPFTCGDACDCRFDEACEDGLCVPTPKPTRYLSPDAGGTGLSYLSPAGDLATAVRTATPGAVLALAADTRFDLPGTLFIDGGTSSIEVNGGYVTCGPRWVREGTRTTQVKTATLGPAVHVNGSLSAPAPGLKVRNLSLENLTATGMPCSAPLLDVTQAPSLTVEHVLGHYELPGGSNCGTNGQRAVFRCAGCSSLSARHIELLPSQSENNVVTAAVRLTNVSGTLRGTVMRALPRNTAARIRGIDVDGLVGPLTISDSFIEPMVASAEAYAARVQNCGAFPVTISRNQFGWVSLMVAGASSAGLRVDSCADTTVVDNVIDGRTVVTGDLRQAYGLDLRDSSGVVQRNQVFFPVYSNFQYIFQHVGMLLFGPRAGFVVSENTTSLGSGTNVVIGATFQNISSPGARDLTIERNVFGGGTSQESSYGMLFLDVFSPARALVRENVVVPATHTAPCGAAAGAYGLHADNSVVRIERNSIRVPSAVQAAYGVSAVSSSQLELYDNHVWVGPVPVTCSGSASVALAVNGGSTVYAIGNTLEAEGDPAQTNATAGFECADGATLDMTSNLVGGGRGTQPLMVRLSAGTGTCLNPARFRKNWFFHSRAGFTRHANENVHLIALAGDAGVPDLNGNVIGESQGCFEQTLGPARVTLSPTSGCIDKGAAGARLDASVLTQALDGGPRTVGAAPDIGCSERQ